MAEDYRLRLVASISAAERVSLDVARLNHEASEAADAGGRGKRTRNESGTERAQATNVHDEDEMPPTLLRLPREIGDREEGDEGGGPAIVHVLMAVPGDTGTFDAAQTTTRVLLHVFNPSGQVRRDVMRVELNITWTDESSRPRPGAAEASSPSPALDVRVTDMHVSKGTSIKRVLRSQFIPAMARGDNGGDGNGGDGSGGDGTLLFTVDLCPFCLGSYRVELSARRRGTATNEGEGWAAVTPWKPVLAASVLLGPSSSRHSWPLLVERPSFEGVRASFLPAEVVAKLIATASVPASSTSSTTAAHLNNGVVVQLRRYRNVLGERLFETPLSSGAYVFNAPHTASALIVLLYLLIPCVVASSVFCCIAHVRQRLTFATGGCIRPCGPEGQGRMVGWECDERIKNDGRHAFKDSSGWFPYCRRCHSGPTQNGGIVIRSTTTAATAAVVGWYISVCVLSLVLGGAVVLGALLFRERGSDIMMGAGIRLLGEGGGPHYLKAVVAVAACLVCHWRLGTRRGTAVCVGVPTGVALALFLLPALASYPVECKLGWEMETIAGTHLLHDVRSGSDRDSGGDRGGVESLLYAARVRCGAESQYMEFRVYHPQEGSDEPTPHHATRQRRKPTTFELVVGVKTPQDTQTVARLSRASQVSLFGFTTPASSSFWTDNGISLQRRSVSLLAFLTSWQDNIAHSIYPTIGAAAHGLDQPEPGHGIGIALPQSMGVTSLGGGLELFLQRHLSTDDEKGLDAGLEDSTTAVFPMRVCLFDVDGIDSSATIGAREAVLRTIVAAHTDPVRLVAMQAEAGRGKSRSGEVEGRGGNGEGLEPLSSALHGTGLSSAVCGLLRGHDGMVGWPTAGVFVTSARLVTSLLGEVLVSIRLTNHQLREVGVPFASLWGAGATSSSSQMPSLCIPEAMPVYCGTTRPSINCSAGWDETETGTGPGPGTETVIIVVPPLGIVTVFAALPPWNDATRDTSGDGTGVIPAPLCSALANKD